MSRTFVIAEAAGTHDGDLAKAYQLVDLAASIGADACKFQWVSSPERLIERRGASEYLSAYRVLAFPQEWLVGLALRCEDHRIELMVTCYLSEDISVVAPYVSRFKVSSFEATDRQFISAHFPYGKPLIISLGMMDAREVGIMDAWLSGYSRYEPCPLGLEVTLLHCISAYPAPVEQMNLRVISAFRWDVLSGYGENLAFARVGLSDHSRHPLTGGLAIAAGAEMIEFHLRLWDTSEGNADFAVSRTPGEAREYVANIRLAEQMMGSGEKVVQSSERPLMKYRVEGKP